MDQAPGTAAPGETRAPDEARRRPRDRRQQITAAAASQFSEMGFHEVSMASIADAVGITASALYRHFDDKQALLRATILEALDRFDAAIAGTADPEDLLWRTAETAIAYRELSTLWHRETRHLDPADQRTIRGRMRANHAQLVALLAADRPRVPEPELELRAWAIQSVHASAGHHHQKLTLEQLTALLHAAADSIRHLDLLSEDGQTDPPQGGRAGGAGRLTPASRRESLLAVAVELMHERGYRAVSLDDIGAEIGIAGPSVYHHFPSKAAILVAAFRRGGENLALSLHHALAQSISETDALDRLVRSYIRLVLDHTALFSLLVTEAIHLPQESRDELRQQQHEYLAEWVALLRASRPDLDEAAAFALVHAAVSVITDASRTSRLRQRPGPEEDLLRLARAVLRAPVPADRVTSRER